MREKHTALMKPIVFALEHVRSITAAPAETPHEKWFQDNYGDAIENALEKLKTPLNPAKPGSSWIPFKEVLRNLKNVSKMGSPLCEIENLNKGTFLTGNTREDFVSPWKAACDQLLIRNIEKGVFFILSGPRVADFHLQRFAPRKN